jgi:hypothetical protein
MFIMSSSCHHARKSSLMRYMIVDSPDISLVSCHSCVFFPPYLLSCLPCSYILSKFRMYPIQCISIGISPEDKLQPKSYSYPSLGNLFPFSFLALSLGTCFFTSSLSFILFNVISADIVPLSFEGVSNGLSCRAFRTLVRFLDKLTS